MKSRTYFYNPTILRNDIIRFSPVWVLYTAGLLIFLLTSLGSTPDEVNRAYFMQGMIPFMLAINGLYAILNAVLLFNDLLNPRVCSAVHALPLTRDDFFRTHAFAGFCFSIIPNAVVILATLPFLGNGMPMAMYVAASCVATYIFYFGTALLSVQLAGNLVASVLIYGLINFFALLLAWFARELYEPILLGIEIPIRNTLWKLCPTVSMMEKQYVSVITAGEYPQTLRVAAIKRVGGWGAMGIWTIVGLVELAASQMLYRARKLEVAGDLVAYKRTRPVFLVLYTLMVGGFFHLVGDSMNNATAKLVFLFFGLAVGWITGQMLLERQLKIFTRKTMLPMAAILAVAALSLVITALDPLGICGKIPDADQIEFVQIYDHSGDGQAKLTTSAEIEDVRAMHQRAFAGYRSRNLRSILSQDRNTYYYSVSDLYSPMVLTYTLKNGKTLTRSYSVQVESKDGEILKTWLSRPECVFNTEFTDVEALAAKITYFDVYNYTRLGGYWNENVDVENQIGLLNAMLRDCAEGNLLFSWKYHRNEGQAFYIHIAYDELDEKGMSELRGYYHPDLKRWVDIYIRPCCTNTLNWFVENGYMTAEELDHVLHPQIIG